MKKYIILLVVFWFTSPASLYAGGRPKWVQKPKNSVKGYICAVGKAMVFDSISPKDRKEAFRDGEFQLAMALSTLSSDLAEKWNTACQDIYVAIHLPLLKKLAQESKQLKTLHPQKIRVLAWYHDKKSATLYYLMGVPRGLFLSEFEKKARQTLLSDTTLGIGKKAKERALQRLKTILSGKKNASPGPSKGIQKGDHKIPQSKKKETIVSQKESHSGCQKEILALKSQVKDLTERMKFIEKMLIRRTLLKQRLIEELLRKNKSLNHKRYVFQQALNLQNPDPKKRDFSAGNLIGQRDPSTIPYLITALGDRNKRVRLSAARALGDMGEKSLNALIKALNRKSTYTKIFGCFALNKLKDKAAPAVPMLIKQLRDSRHVVRAAAALTLGEIGPKSARATLPLIQRLTDKYPDVRLSSAYALGKVCPGQDFVVPYIVATIHDSDEMVRRACAQSLGEIGSPYGIKGLISALGDQSSKVRRVAAISLGNMGKGASSALPFLIQILQDPIPKVRRDGARALGRLHSPSAIPYLLDSLKDSQTMVVLAVLSALTDLQAKKALPYIEKLFHHKKKSIRQKARETQRMLKGGLRKTRDHAK